MFERIISKAWEQAKNEVVTKKIFTWERKNNPEVTIKMADCKCPEGIYNTILEDFLIDANAQYRIGPIFYKEKGYGFCSNIFCHVSKFVGDKTNFENICKKTIFYVPFSNGSKGRIATSIIPFENIDEETALSIANTIKNMLIDIAFDNAVVPLRKKILDKEEAEREAAKAAAEAAKSAKLKELGIISFRKQVVKEYMTYGGHKHYEFFFESDKEITKEIFCEFLKIEGLVVTPKIIDIPVSQETVEMYSWRTNCWVYKWSGMWTD